MGVSLRRFEGWSPVEVWDIDVWGRPTVRRRVLEESEWNPEQRAWMLALAYVEDHECPGCGGWLPETTDPATDPDDPRNAVIWKSSGPTRCHRCTVVARRRGEYKDVEHSHALLFHAELAPRRRPR